jgi:tetratricopeptide (TPR) repeat protein
MRSICGLGSVLVALIGLFAGAALCAELPDFMMLWDFEHPDSAEAKFRALLPAARTAGDGDYLGQLLTQIARAQGLQERFASADSTLAAVAPLLRGDRSQLQVRYLLERGRVRNSSGDMRAAEPLFREAWRTARQAGLDGLAVDAAHMIAIVTPPDSALVWNVRALDLVEASTDPKAKGWAGSLYNNLGWTYHDRGEFEKALELFERGFEWRKGQGQTVEARIAAWCVGRALRSLGRLDEALAAQLALQAEWDAAGGSDGYVEEEIAECLLALDRPSEAGPWFARAYKNLSEDPWLTRNEPDRLKRLAELGGVQSTWTTR